LQPPHGRRAALDSYNYNGFIVKRVGDKHRGRLIDLGQPLHSANKTEERERETIVRSQW